MKFLGSDLTELDQSHRRYIQIKGQMEKQVNNARFQPASRFYQEALASEIGKKQTNKQTNKQLPTLPQFSS